MRIERGAPVRPYRVPVRASMNSITKGTPPAIDGSLKCDLMLSKPGASMKRTFWPRWFICRTITS